MKNKIGFLLVFLCIAFVSKAQEVKINDFFVVESDGTFRLDSTARVWEDLTVPGMNAKPGALSPDWLVYKGGIFLWDFKKTGSDELCFTVQMPHAWKLATNLKPHIHWIPKADATTTNVTWTLEYFWINIDGTFSGTTTISSSTVSKGTPTVDTHVITGLGTISGSGHTISSILVCRLYRDGDNGSDTFDASASLLQIDFHYEIDTEGSRTEYEK